MITKSSSVVIISNITFEPYLRTYITKAFLPSAVQVNYVPYEEIYENQIAIQGSDIIVIYLNFDVLYPNAINDIVSRKISHDDITHDSIKRCQELYSSIRSRSNAQIIWFGFEDYYVNSDIVCGSVSVSGGAVDGINQAISEMLTDDVYVDLKRLIAKIGISNSYSVKGKYRWNAPYSKELMALMANEMYKQYSIHIGKTKKCIILDCDNVLWGGILSEDGIEGIRLDGSGLGREYQEFQRFLLMLYYHGVILTVCSKNDESDVLRVFREHSGMLLKEEHVACFKVNWNDKPTNIQMIADELNIGTDSMVFVDDSRFELEAVKTVLPEVTAIRYDREFMYNEFACFNLKKKVDLPEIEHRNNTYRTNYSRMELQSQCGSYDEYIKSLNMKVDIHKLLPVEYDRVAELTQRTNKCTNGKRYTVSEIRERTTLPGVHFYSVSVSDRFCDLGIVGAIEIEEQTLSLFSLSCRALGRRIEQEMIKYITKKYCINDLYFKSTGKNGNIYELLELSFGNKMEKWI